MHRELFVLLLLEQAQQAGRIQQFLLDRIAR